MPLIALAAVLLAAVTHATWNLAAKRAAGSRHFVWLYSTGSVIVYTPAVLWIVVSERPQFEPVHWFALGATAVLHLCYSLMLQAGYRASDLSLVYPLRDRRGAASEAREYFKPAAVVSVLGPLGYILVLFAMQIAPISHVAPARELSTLIGAYLGARLLRERAAPARIAGAACIVVGVIALAFADFGG